MNISQFSLKFCSQNLINFSMFVRISGVLLHLTYYDMIYLLTAIGLSPGGSSTVHIYTQTIHRTTQNKQYIEQKKNTLSFD
jgi:hypothetical protein